MSETSSTHMDGIEAFCSVSTRLLAYPAFTFTFAP